MIIEESVNITRPPQEVFCYIVDLSHLPEWDKTAVAAEQTSSGAVEFGARFRAELAVAGRTIELQYEVLDHQPYYTATLLGSGKSLTAQDKIVTRPTEDGGTDLTVTSEVLFRGATKALAPVLGPAMSRRTKAAVQALKQKLEAA